ncbi:serine hydrolase domain-containing protein [Microbulbifer sp. SA54]|uniref:serine hydrolase domain-containing protein n=1 Tax=Microbulbifer sp. SA54 TaxID=3401577 RepID=UPI003AAF75E8
MDSIFIGFLVLGILSWLLSKFYRWLGRQLRRAHDTLEVLTGLSAKLACSARHISGFDRSRILHDLKGYSWAFRFVDLKFENSQVIARIGRIRQSRATYHKGLGCTLGSTLLYDPSRIRVPTITPDHHTWPQEGNSGHSSLKAEALLDQILKEDLENQLETRALIAIQNGELVAESYAPLISRETKLLGWSMAKSLTALLVGRMETLGLADIHAQNLFAEWHGDGKSRITLQQLLQMCPGLAFDENYAPGSDVTRMLFTTPGTADYALRSKLQHPPGSHFHYSSGTTNLLALWMHRKLGGTQACIDFLFREFLEPLQMANTLLETDACGVFTGSSYAYASARDWARLGQLILDNGCIGSQALISPDWIHRATSPNTSANDPRYGYQLWLNSAPGTPPRYQTLPADACFMLGNREQKLMVCPSHRAVVVRLGWTSGDYPMERQFARILSCLGNP